MFRLIYLCISFCVTLFLLPIIILGSCITALGSFFYIFANIAVDTAEDKPKKKYPETTWEMWKAAFMDTISDEKVEHKAPPQKPKQKDDLEFLSEAEYQAWVDKNFQ